MENQRNLHDCNRSGHLEKGAAERDSCDMETYTTDDSAINYNLICRFHSFKHEMSVKLFLL